MCSVNEEASCFEFSIKGGSGGSEGKDKADQGQKLYMQEERKARQTNICGVCLKGNFHVK